MKILKIASIIILGTLLIMGINTPSVNKDEECHPIIDFLTEFAFLLVLAIPLIYIVLS